MLGTEQPKTAVALAEQIRARIEAGDLAVGERLQSIRDLALQVGLNRNTVAASYRKLHQAGLIEPSGRSMRVALRPLGHEKRHLREIVPGVVDLSFNNPDPALLPDMRSALARLDLGFPSLYGDDPDHALLLDHFKAWHAKLGFAKGEGMIIPGTTEGMDRLLQLYFEPGDRVAIEDPCYMKLLHLVRGHGLQPVPVAMGEDGILPESLATALSMGAKGVFITPRAHNPTGASLTKGRAAKLRSVLEGYPDVLIVEDEHAGPLLDAQCHSVIDHNRTHWAVCHSVAKYLGPDLRVAALFGSNKTVSRLRSHRALGGQWVSHLLQDLAVALLNDGSFEETVAQSAKAYQARREALERALRERGISFWKGQGLNLWIETKNAEHIAARLFRSGWNVRTGTEFCLLASNGLRITISSLSTNEAKNFAEDLSHIVMGEAGGAL